jgi:hypothetical protein
MSFDVNDPFNLKACFGPQIPDFSTPQDEQLVWNPVRPEYSPEILEAMQKKYNDLFSLRIEATRWPEGAEL